MWPTKQLTYISNYKPKDKYIHKYTICACIYIYIYMVRRSAAPPPSPPKVNGPDIGWGPPSPLVWGVGPSSPCGVVVGFWGLGFSLSL